MVNGSETTVSFRLWPPVAIGAPLVVGWLATQVGGLVLFPAAVLLVLWGAIRPEERFLHARSGAPYDDYRRRVRPWL